MQLKNATPLERRIVEICQQVETAMAASKLATDISATLSESGNELQRLRQHLATLTAERDRLAGELEAVRAKVEERRALAHSRLEQAKKAGDGYGQARYGGAVCWMDELQAALAPAAGVSHE